MHHSQYRPHIIRDVKSTYQLRPGDVFQFMGDVKSFICKSIRHAGERHEVITTECGHVFFVRDLEKLRTWTEATHIAEILRGPRKGDVVYALQWQILPDMSAPSDNLFSINSDLESRSILQGVTPYLSVEDGDASVTIL